MKTFTTASPPGGVNFNLLCEQAHAEWGEAYLGLNIGQEGEVIIHFTDTSPADQSAVDTLVAAHDAAQESSGECARAAIAAAMSTLTAVDTAEPIEATQALLAALVTIARGH
jgi:anti-anti-sigma regulatory factor